MTFQVEDVSVVVDVLLDGILFHCKTVLNLLERVPSFGLVLASLDPLEASWVRTAKLRHCSTFTQGHAESQWSNICFNDAARVRILLLRLQSRLAGTDLTRISKECLTNLEALLAVYSTLVQYADNSI